MKAITSVVGRPVRESSIVGSTAHFNSNSRPSSGRQTWVLTLAVDDELIAISATHSRGRLGALSQQGRGGRRVW
jgi:hypothetical protein